MEAICRPELAGKPGEGRDGVSPPALPSTRPGGTATPTKNELITAGRTILDHFGIAFGNSKLFRLAINFKAKCPNAGRYLFFQFLAAEAQLSDGQKRAALADPNIARCISYRDPVGEEDVRRVMRDRGQR